VINGSGSPREKSKALFVLAQAVAASARDSGQNRPGQINPDLQRKAVEYLGSSAAVKRGKRWPRLRIEWRRLC